MPFGRFKKKKKKDLPPSLSNTGQSMFDEVLGELRAAREAPTQNPPEKVEKPTILSTPPQETIPSFSNSEYNIQGPPRNTPTTNFKKSSELQGPPRESYNKRPSNVSRASFEEQSSSYAADQLSDEILNELKIKDFHPDLVKTPPKRFIPKSTEDLKKHRLQETKREYLTAASKQLELNFFDNAATDTACAILCILISDGVDAARTSMSKLSSNLPAAVLNNVIFENVRILLDSTRNKNYAFLSRAEKALKGNMQQLYPEDIAIIESGIKTAKSYFGLE